MWNIVPPLTTIGWWASAADIYNTSPSKTIDLSVNRRYANFMVAPSDFVGYTGNWYLLDANGRAYSAINNPDFPRVSAITCGCTELAALHQWSSPLWTRPSTSGSGTTTTNNDVTGKSVPQGEKLGFRIDTNMYPAVNNDHCATTSSTGAPLTDNFTLTKDSLPVGTCQVCTNQQQFCVNQSFTDGINWATWMLHPGDVCYTSASAKRYAPVPVSGNCTDVPKPLAPGSMMSLAPSSQVARTLLTYVFTNPQDTPINFGLNPGCGSEYLDPALDGYINIKVKDEANAQSTSSTMTTAIAADARPELGHEAVR